VTTPPDDRSPAAKAYQWAARIMVVSLEMVLPGVAGYWLDQQLRTVFVFLLLGVVFGVIVAVWHLVQMTSSRLESRRFNGDNSPKDQ
jgi:hypothetical protein